MSIYSCIESIDNLLSATGNTPIPTEKLRTYLIELKDTLSRIEKMDAPIEPLSKIREQLLQDLKETKIPELETIRPQLEDICSDLKTIASQLSSGVIPDIFSTLPFQLPEEFKRRMDTVVEQLQSNLNPMLPAYWQLRQNEKLTIAKMHQGKTLAIGNSLGECYGICKAMVDPKLSPYDGHEFKFDQAVYNYQKSQFSRIADQQTIGHMRQGREHFSATIQEQAEALYLEAEKHLEENLMVHLRVGVARHAIYLSKRDGKIRYMDPNHGAFLFNSKEQFIAAFRLIYMANPAPAYQFYSIHKMSLNPQNEPEKRTLQGKLRTMATGAKYAAPWESFLTRLAHGTIGTLLGGATGAIIGTLIFPFIGTMIGALVGGVVGGGLAYKAAQVAEKHGHRGLLGTYHGLRTWLHKKFGKKEIADLAKLTEPLFSDDKGQHSYGRVLKATSAVHVSAGKSPQEDLVLSATGTSKVPTIPDDVEKHDETVLGEPSREEPDEGFHPG